MADEMPHMESAIARPSGFFSRLARDTSANTLALVAAAILPLMGMVGGGVDMGRAYLAQARLQQACDAGVLAARKSLGSEPIVTGDVPAEVAQFGQRFFNLNFRDGIYATEDRTFQMTLEDDYSISGVAEVNVPTSIMGIFGFDEVPVAVECEAKLNFAALDLMMVLDVTGSMRQTNPGDSATRIDLLKSTILSFHSQLEAAKTPGTPIRYGFVPYASNVNVSHLLEDDWVTNTWTYQSRELESTTRATSTKTKYVNFVAVSGTRTAWVTESSYPAKFYAASSDAEGDTYKCEQAKPANTVTVSSTKLGETTEPYEGPPSGTKVTEQYSKTANGDEYRTIASGSTCEIQKRTSTGFTEEYEKVTYPIYVDKEQWLYRPIEFDVSNWREDTEGCVEERESSYISDYTNVDFTVNRDLDLDTIPNAIDSSTQWRPIYSPRVYARSLDKQGNGEFTSADVRTDKDFVQSGLWWFSTCPTARAEKLAEMTNADLTAYLDTLVPSGATYHDLGMIWGGRLISPNGLFATENADTGTGQEKSRHLIFLTDGQTEVYDLAYGAYGIEGLDRRRWAPDSPKSLAETVDQRFAFACEEVKKRNVTVWVIAFGTSVNSYMTTCAGEGRYFEASNSAELNDAFTSIARSLGDLRIAK